MLFVGHLTQVVDRDARADADREDFRVLVTDFK